MDTVRVGLCDSLERPSTFPVINMNNKLCSSRTLLHCFTSIFIFWLSLAVPWRWHRVLSKEAEVLNSLQKDI